MPIPVIGLHNEDKVFVNGSCVLNEERFMLIGSFVAFFIPLVIMVVTYCLTIQVLQRQATVFLYEAKTSSQQPLHTPAMTNTLQPPATTFHLPQINTLAPSDSQGKHWRWNVVYFNHKSLIRIFLINLCMFIRSHKPSAIPICLISVNEGWKQLLVVAFITLLLRLMSVFYLVSSLKNPQIKASTKQNDAFAVLNKLLTSDYCYGFFYFNFKNDSTKAQPQL